MEARAQARAQAWAQAGPNLGAQQIPKIKILKIKIHSAQNVGRVWSSRKKILLAPFGHIWAHFLRGPEKSKKRENFAYFPWWAHGPYSPGLGPFTNLPMQSALVKSPWTQLLCTCTNRRRCIAERRWLKADLTFQKREKVMKVSKLVGNILNCSGQKMCT